MLNTVWHDLAQNEIHIIVMFSLINVLLLLLLLIVNYNCVNYLIIEYMDKYSCHD